MAKVLVNESSLQDIADAIREKTEGTETFLPSAMAAAIRAIELGGLKSARGTLTSANTKTLTVSGMEFEPAVAFYAVNAAGSYSQYGFACPDATYVYASGNVSATFTPNPDGFTFTGSGNIVSSSAARTIYWYAFG